MRLSYCLATIAMFAAPAAFALPVAHPDNLVLEQCSQATLNLLAKMLNPAARSR